MIDTFAKIRSQNERKRQANANNCFICNIERRAFEISLTTTFQEHKTKCHNVVAYTDFFVHTQEKNIDDLTGIETHVLQRIKSKQIDWFPLDHAGDLMKQDATAEEPRRLIVPMAR